jgi:hypothetical protein
VRLFHNLVLLLLVFPTLAVAQQGSCQQASPCVPGMPMPGCPNSSAQQMGDQQSGAAQSAQQGGPEDGPGMQMGQTGLMSMQGMPPQTFVQAIARHATSGTSAEPDSTPAPMLMVRKGAWMLMFHANVFVLDLQQSSPRGGDKFFSTNWLMPMAQRELGNGIFTVRAMLSLEPATITDRRYPLLFQQGETAFGVPIADGQHPHNFFMEVAALYDLKLGAQTLLSFYFAPVGDPAIGPTAYPHRASAIEDPVAPLGHHQEDSTHIADDVVTAGLTYRFVRIESSGFHGREPNEFRWDIDQGKIDSWSTRLTVQPGKNWSGQYSFARITSPEALFPTENQERMTASIMYNRPFREGNWASTLLWGRTRSLQDNTIFNSYLFESTIRFHRRNYAWTRIENVERSNELIIGENPLPSGFIEQPIGRVQAYTLGYDHDFDVIPHVASAIGAQFTTYGVADALQPIYGSHPFGVALFVRLRPVSGRGR